MEGTAAVLIENILRQQGFHATVASFKAELAEKKSASSPSSAPMSTNPPDNKKRPRTEDVDSNVATSASLGITNDTIAAIEADASGRFACPFISANGTPCGATFTLRNNLRRHWKSHLGIGMHTCTECGRSFVRADDFASHQKSHGIQPVSSRASKSAAAGSAGSSSSKDTALGLGSLPLSALADGKFGLDMGGLGSSFSGMQGLMGISGLHGEHNHGMQCGHTPVLLGGQVAYLMEDGSIEPSHALQGLGAITNAAGKTSTVPITESNPARCTPDHSCSTHGQDHQHGPSCGHPRVKHGDHFDYLVDGHLHHLHSAAGSSPSAYHCDDHGELPSISDDVLALLDTLGPQVGLGMGLGLSSMQLGAGLAALTAPGASTAAQPQANPAPSGDGTSSGPIA